MTDSVRTKHCNAMLTKIGELRTNDKYCDIDVKVDGRVFKCHRLVLSAAAEYFDVMFSGTFKENGAMEVTLEEIEENVFEGILEFVYTGVVVITCSNLYNFIRAADFYKMPLLEELCIEFMQKNFDALANNILLIFSFAHTAGMKQIADLLSRHIYENFLYFCQTPEFLKLTSDNLMAILKEIENRPILHDMFLESAFRWIQSQVDLPIEKKRTVFNKITKKIDFKNLSAEYSKYMVNHYIKDFLSDKSTEDNFLDSDIWTPKKSLHAYVARSFQGDGLSTATSIFSRYRKTGVPNKNESYMWVYSGELKNSVDFMRNITIDNCLYSLKYFKRHGDVNNPRMTFSSSSMANIYPSSSLQLPPLILDDFDLCGINDNIYLCNKNTFSNTSVVKPGNSTFSEDELSRGIFLYKRDVDIWLPVPCPKKRFAYACMTCDNNGLVYLIGGLNSNKYVQAYDSRMSEWTTLPPTDGVYNGGACCVYKNQIWVAGGQQNPQGFEMFDPILGIWQSMKNLPVRRTDKHQLLVTNSVCGCYILSFNYVLNSIKSSISGYCANKNTWYYMPNLYKAVERTKFDSFNELCILDMIEF